MTRAGPPEVPPASVYGQEAHPLLILGLIAARAEGDGADEESHQPNTETDQPEYGRCQVHEDELRATRPAARDGGRQIGPVKMDRFELQPNIWSCVPQEARVGFVQATGNSDLGDR